MHCENGIISPTAPPEPVSATAEDGRRHEERQTTQKFAPCGAMCRLWIVLVFIHVPTVKVLKLLSNCVNGVPFKTQAALVWESSASAPALGQWECGIIAGLVINVHILWIKLFLRPTVTEPFKLVLTVADKMMLSQQFAGVGRSE